MDELHDAVAAYLSRKISVCKLEVELLRHLQSILDSGSEKEIKLANEIDASLIEMGEGLMSEEEFRLWLGAYDV